MKLGRKRGGKGPRGKMGQEIDELEAEGDGGR